MTDNSDSALNDVGNNVRCFSADCRDTDKMATRGSSGLCSVGTGGEVTTAVVLVATA